LANLRVDFYESGIGDTIILTFPSGAIGIVDAHPSSKSVRPKIETLIQGKNIRFVCLTHPHTDHGKDLIPVLASSESITEFWTSVSDISLFNRSLKKYINFPSPLADRVSAFEEARAAIFSRLFGEVARRLLEDSSFTVLSPMSSDTAMQDIEGVEIYCLSPDKSVLNEERRAYLRKVDDPLLELPDPNPLSIVLALKFGNTVTILGADAYKENWVSAAQVYKKYKLPKAMLLKVPHHGASNSYNFGKGLNYLDLCSASPNPKAVIFAGDPDHPNRAVFKKLREKAEPICLGNGLKLDSVYNPLALQIVGAHAQYPVPICNPVISFEIERTGGFRQTAGARFCSDCFPN
jgi:hypothetical protein